MYRAVQPKQERIKMYVSKETKVRGENAKLNA